MKFHSFHQVIAAAGRLIGIIGDEIHVGPLATDARDHAPDDHFDVVRIYRCEHDGSFTLLREESVA